MPFALVLALALRLALWYLLPLHQPANDEVEYVAVARDLLAGRGWRFYEHYHWLRAPLYPLFLAASFWVTGGAASANAAEALHRAALPNIALSVANVYLCYWLALALVGRRAARVAALLTALLWTFVTFASLYMSETLFTFLFTAGLLCLARPAGGGRWAASAGVLFGLATLTRSITLLFLPVVALWLLLGREARGEGQGARGWRTAICFVLATLLVIAPWTIRNYAAYGRPILVETGLSYNLWAFNEPHEDKDTIHRTLENIPNPAERSDYATAKGIRRLREDPAILLRKIGPGWVYLLRVKPIEDRFLQESYYSDVSPALFVSALIFDDALYLVIALASMAGLALCRSPSPPLPPSPTRGRGGYCSSELLRAVAGPKWLLIAWLAYAILTIVLTHGESRYRHFLFPALIPYAAWALVRIVDCRLQIVDWKNDLPSLVRSPRFALMIVILMLVGGTALSSYPLGWAAQNLARGWHETVADLAWAAGDTDAALAADQRAIDALKTPDTLIRLGDHARALGDTPRALRAYRSATGLISTYIPAIARLGDLLRETGDDANAREAFDAGYTDDQKLTDWSWRDLRPAPRAALDVGDGLDFGYVGGMYPAEQQQGAMARWTNGRGMLRLGAASGPALLRLRLAGPRPDGAPASAQVCVENRCTPLSVTPTWRVYSVPIDITSSGGVTVELRSDTFGAPDERRLGLLIDRADVVMK